MKENIRYIGDLRRVPPQEIADRGHRYLHMFDMDRFGDRLAGKLSGGMKQKLALVCALVPQPRVSCCWMSRPPASIRFRAANSGTRWRIWRPTA